MDKRTFITGTGAFLLGGCAGEWRVSYKEALNFEVTRNWRVADVIVEVPKKLKVSNENRLAPNADIVWHGEPKGDRRTQVSTIVDEGVTIGAAPLRGQRPVVIAVRLLKFHAITPLAMNVSPAGVHNIQYMAQVFDPKSRRWITEATEIEAALEANMGYAAVVAAVNGRTERERIVRHIAEITRGWLGLGNEPRRTFTGLGR